MAVLQRKIDNILREWKAKEDRKPLVIKGCRQCGKTFSVRNFASQNYDNVIYINFMEMDEYNIAFEKSRRIDDIILNITTIMEDKVKFEAVTLTEKGCHFLES